MLEIVNRGNVKFWSGRRGGSGKLDVGSEKWEVRSLRSR